MQRQLIHSFLLLAGIMITMSACLNDPHYSKVPAISFKSVQKIPLQAGTGVGQSKRDSVVVTIGYQDGDGDLGEDVNDTNRIKQLFTNETWGNYELRTFQLVNGKFTELILAANSKLFFPRLVTQEGQKGSIEGVIDFSQKYFYQTGYKLVPVKFQVRIRDRAFNVSNTIETDTIQVPISGR